MELDSPVTKLQGVGPALQQTLGRLGIRTIQNLIENYPRRYNDFSAVTLIRSLRPGDVTIKARIKQVTGRYVRRGMHITEAVASDASGSVRLVWFNQPYRAASLKSHTDYFISGHFELSYQKFAIISPACELVSDFPLNTARILPVYRETKGLTSAQIRKCMKHTIPLIDSLSETLPQDIVTKHRLLSRAQALHNIHFPESTNTLEQAKYRLGFEEVFELSLAALLNKQASKQDTALTIPFKPNLAKQFVEHLPFTLTDDQRKVAWQIYQDMDKKQPMNRIVEGDVGSGKTVVATMAALMAMEQGFQVALMAPTELLARQHADTIYAMLQNLGFAEQVALLVGGMTPSQKKLAHKRITDGTARFLVGTHTLIQDKVITRKLGLVIIDEQHRFGVEQRKTLLKKAGHMPHVLTMTATPIPRSLALTLYGELDISVIQSKPRNRLPIITKLTSPNSRPALYTTIDQQITEGRQVFVVCPLVNESESLPAAAAERMYDDLRKHAFKHRRVGLLHGQQKAAEKQAIMEQFIRHELDVLVSTTVIEVGVDVPNATVMLIENAERFGLAQLHQLRGRVGRSGHQGYCYLMLGDSKAPSKRLRALESTQDGFRLAELDLELRGPGAIYGTMQHGALDLRVARLTDTKLIAGAKQAAQQAIDDGVNLLDYKHLAARVEALRAVTNLN